MYIGRGVSTDIAQITLGFFRSLELSAVDPVVDNQLALSLTLHAMSPSFRAHPTARDSCAGARAGAIHSIQTPLNTLRAGALTLLTHPTAAVSAPSRAGSIQPAQGLPCVLPNALHTIALPLLAHPPALDLVQPGTWPIQPTQTLTLLGVQGAHSSAAETTGNCSTKSRLHSSAMRRCSS